MNFFKLFLIGIFLVDLIGGGLLFAYNSDWEDDIIENQVVPHLENVLSLKKQRINFSLENKKNDVIFLSELDDVKNLFSEKLIKDKNLVYEQIKRISKKTTEEIENFLIENPEMTLDDLRENKEFRDIVLSRVGETGYTVLGSYDNGEILIHESRDFEGVIVRNNVQLEGLGEIENLTYLGRDAFGYYDWVEPNGEVKQKYADFSIAKVKTADGVGLSVVSTTYVDEYGEILILEKSMEDYLNDFRIIKGYSDVILINPEGEIVWTALKENDLAMNIGEGIYNKSLLGEVYKKVRRDFKTDVSGFGEYSPIGERALFVMSPVFDYGKFVGLVALRLTGDDMKNLLLEDLDFRGHGEVYIIDSEGLPVVPLKYFKDIKYNDTITDYFREYYDFCFEDSENVSSFFNFYENYAGMEVLGVFEKFGDYNWCMIAEVDEDYFLKTFGFRKDVIFRMILVENVIIIFISFFLDGFFKIKRRKKK